MYANFFVCEIFCRISLYFLLKALQNLQNISALYLPFYLCYNFLVHQLPASHWRNQLLARQRAGGHHLDRLHYQGEGEQGDQPHEGAQQSTGNS